MVNFYCRTCGLYISVPTDFAGGQGCCPRCRGNLQVPHPVSKDNGFYVDGLRYISEPAGADPPGEARPAIATAAAGPSSRYRCDKCGEEYESIKAQNRPQGQCPRCETVNSPIYDNVPFPREYALGDQADQAVGTDWKMDGEFLVAARAEEQELSDSVIQGLPLLPEGQGEALGLSLNGAEKSSPGLDPEIEEPPSPGGGSGGRPASPDHVPSASPDGIWYYRLKDRKQGPVTTGQLKDMLQAGKVERSGLVWKKGMKNWQPIELFGELAVDNDFPAGEWVAQAEEHDTSPIQQIRNLSRRCTGLFWIFVVVFCIQLLLSVMRQTFADVGRGPFFLANLILVGAILAAIGYGVLLILRNWELFRRVPLRVRMRAMVGVIGLVACLVATASLVAFWRGGEAVRQERQFIVQAQRIFEVMVQGNVDESYLLVDWRKLKVNSADYGARFSAAASQKTERKIIEDTFGEFLLAFEPYYNERELKALGLEKWRVEKRTLTKTVVSVAIPSTRKKIVFTIQGGRLIELDVN